jgi:hypothetical protein
MHIRWWDKMKRDCFIVLLISVLSLVAVASGNDGVICGHVYDAETNEPISSSAFVRSQEGKNAPTNADGYYAIEGCSPFADYTLNCYSPGYKSVSRAVTTDGNGNAEVDFSLLKEGTGSRQDTSTGSVNYPQVEEISTTPGPMPAGSIDRHAKAAPMGQGFNSVEPPNLEGTWIFNMGEAQVSVIVHQSSTRIFGACRSKYPDSWDAVMTGSISSEGDVYLDVLSIQNLLHTNIKGRVDSGTISGKFTQADCFGNVDCGEVMGFQVTPDITTYF